MATTGFGKSVRSTNVATGYVRDIPTGMSGISLADVVRFLPFEYTAYFPAAVWLGKITGWELVTGLVIEFTWLVVMIGVCRFVWWRGTKRYSGFGG